MTFFQVNPFDYLSVPRRSGINIRFNFPQLTLWGVQVPNSEIIDYMKLAGLTWPIHKGLVRAHFNMEDTSGSVIVSQEGNGFHGNLVGRPVFVPVSNKL